MTVGHVAGCWRYPVKSMLGEARERVHVGPTGIVGDRAYAVIDRADGKVASAKNPAKWRGLLDFRAELVDEPAPGSAVPPVVITAPDGRRVRSDDADVDRVLSDHLGRDVHLVDLAAAPGGPPVLEEVWPAIDGLAPEAFVEATRVGVSDDQEAVSDIPMGLFAPPGTFFDVSPLHVLTTATLDRLRELEPAADFDARRYRPNFLLDVAGEGFVENDWVGAGVRLGEAAEATVALPTMRCVMTTLAHDDRPVDRVTLRTIARHNRVEITGLGTWTCAGVYATVSTPGPVATGDEVALRPATP